MRPQDKPCHHWLQGNCRFGSGCKFRHDPEEKDKFKVLAHISMQRPNYDHYEQQKPVGVDITDERGGGPENLATNRLVGFDVEEPYVHTVGLNTVSCSRNSNIDDGSDGVSIQQTQSTSSVDPMTPTSANVRKTQYRTTNFPAKQKPCKDWKDGRCQRGERCCFSHDAPLKADGKGIQRDGPTISAEAKVEEERGTKKNSETEGHSRRKVEADAERHREAHRQMREERIAQEKAAREAREEQLRVERERRTEERRRIAERMAMEEEAKKRRQMEMQARREQDAKVVERHPVLDSSLVSFGAGLEIRNIVAGFDLCTMRIKNLPMDAKREEIEDIFVQQGIEKSDFSILQVRPLQDSNKLEAVVLINSEYGYALTPGLEGIPFRNESLTFKVDDNAIGTSMDTANRNTPFVLVTWRVPSDTIVAGYHSLEEARNMAQKLNMTIWKGRQIRAVMNERPQGVAGLRNFNPASVKIMNLPFTGIVPYDFHQFTGTTDHKLLKSSSFDVGESHATIRALISKLPGILMNSYEVMTAGIEDSSGEAKIKVQFEEWEDAKEGHTSISQLEGGMNRPSFKPWLPPKPLRYTIKIPVQQYEAQKRQWDELSTAKVGGDAYVQPRVGSRGDVFIQVLGQDKKAVGQLKVRVESMVAGEKLAPEYWHSSWMTSSGRTFFNRVFNEKKVFTRNDFKSRTLRIYGEPNLVAEVRQMIREEVDRLAQRETTRFLDRGSVGFFVREGLGKLVELLGEENVNLNLASRPCRITVKGGDEANHHLQRMLDESKAAGSFGSVLTAAEKTEVCPICTDEASHPEQLLCGHTYCAGCLKHFLTSAVDAKTFPLVCMGNDATCNVPIPIPFIRRFLPDAVFRALVEAAFVHHLDQHPQEWKYCTTTDCKQIYRRRPEQATLQCPSCFSTICPACHEEAHEGMTCNERRILGNPAEQQRLNEELAKKHGYKKCPQCDVLIEKTEGCNHMSCRCGAHICWRCMAVSDHRGPFNGTTIYEHMNNVHGNIYEQVPVGINLGQVENRAFVAEQADELARIERERLAAQAQAARIRWGFQERDVNIPIIAHAQWVQQQEERRRQELYERDRLVEEENRRRRIAFEQRIARDMQEGREAEERIARERAERQRREAEDRSWCVVM